MLFLLWSLGCDSITVTKESHESDTGSDADGDGFTPGTGDCDDTNSEIYPGAPQQWNGLDNDCDGFVDGDGLYSGTIPISGAGVYEGQAHSFQMNCPGTLQRLGSQLTLNITCTSDPNDPYAQLLIGTQLMITADGNATADAWSGRITFTSSTGWDTQGDAQIQWSSFSALNLSLQLSTFSLDLSGGGSMSR
jgi:hypothetical protein